MLLKKNLIKSIVFDSFYTNYTSKILFEVAEKNSLNKQQIIGLCSFVRNELNKEFDKIDLLVRGLFKCNIKAKKLLIDYKKDLYENVFVNYLDLYTFMISCDTSDVEDIKVQLEKYLLNISTYNGFLDKKNAIEDYYFKKSKYKQINKSNGEDDDYVTKFKTKLLKNYKEK